MPTAAHHPNTSRFGRTGLSPASAALTAAVTTALALALTGCTAAQTEPAATVLQLPTSGGGLVSSSCAELTSEYLAGVPRAFRGEVVSINDGQVALNVTNTYAGDVGERVRLAQQPRDLPSEMTIGVLEVGQTYLIAADGDAVMACGASGLATPELQAVYDAAF